MSNTKCLTDEEIHQVFLAGLVSLLECNGDHAHNHLVHEGCEVCLDKLADLLLLEQATEGLATQ